MGRWEVTRVKGEGCDPWARIRACGSVGRDVAGVEDPYHGALVRQGTCQGKRRPMGQSLHVRVGGSVRGRSVGEKGCSTTAGPHVLSSFLAPGFAAANPQTATCTKRSTSSSTRWEGTRLDDSIVFPKRCGRDQLGPCGNTTWITIRQGGRAQCAGTQALYGVRHKLDGARGTRQQPVPVTWCAT